MNPTQVRRSSYRVVVVDDDRAVLTLLGALFEERGHDCLLVDQPLGATEQILRFAPHVVILDYMMPGLNGGTLARVLRSSRSTRSVPLIIYTAVNTEAVAEAAEAAGAYVVEKGTPLDKVVGLVERLGASQQESGEEAPAPPPA